MGPPSRGLEDSMQVRERFAQLRGHLESLIIGQSTLVDSLLLTLLCNGHLLVEGAPGLAKTRAVLALTSSLEADFQRLQFTPDLLPSDLTGTEVYRPQDGSFIFRRGPLFHNIVLADEVNRAPAKVQSALLEAMAERQITVGAATHRLPELFMVMATQNPIEQEGTYALPEAQLDRFLLHVRVDYPSRDHEREILQLNRREIRDNAIPSLPPEQRLTQAEVFAARREVIERVHVSPALEEYVVEIIVATRCPEKFGKDLSGMLSRGASPRATHALDCCARARAWLAGRDFVLPEDIQNMARNVLRHRLGMSLEATADRIGPDTAIDLLLSRVAVP
jgi:MoxR-like ATPase